jgi:hypothetical protein
MTRTNKVCEGEKYEGKGVLCVGERNEGRREIYICIEKHFRLNSSAVYVVDKYIFVSLLKGAAGQYRGHWAPA